MVRAWVRRFDIEVGHYSQCRRQQVRDLRQWNAQIPMEPHDQRDGLRAQLHAGRHQRVGGLQSVPKERTFGRRVRPLLGEARFAARGFWRRPSFPGVLVALALGVERTVPR